MTRDHFTRTGPHSPERIFLPHRAVKGARIALILQRVGDIADRHLGAVIVQLRQLRGRGGRSFARTKIDLQRGRVTGEGVGVGSAASHVVSRILLPPGAPCATPFNAVWIKG